MFASMLGARVRGRRGYGLRTRWLVATLLGFALLAALGGALLWSVPTHAAPFAVNWPMLRLQLVANGFTKPINLVSPNDGSNRLFVVEQDGLIHIIENGQRLGTPFLDLTEEVFDCGECGLLGLAFPPNFAEAGYFFVNYTSDTNLVGPDTGDEDGIADTVIARVELSDNPNVADASSVTPILVINQPATNHNGGHILFGPDGYLYIGMGDGGGGNDTYENAQDPASLHGKILRIEVGASGSYTVPADNPFVGVQGYRGEIWATGLRNPWRFGFDRTTGDLYVADVGQSNQEEVNHIAAAEIDNGGMNFGWPLYEGQRCRLGSETACARDDLVMPVAIYTHETGDCSVTGGVVYHSQLPNQRPVYLYGDLCTGRVRATQQDGAGWAETILLDTDGSITSFGEDGAGNVYVVDYSGEIYLVLDPANGQYIPSLVKNE
jgi:glucose/arabinose dehydrogenase